MIFVPSLLFANPVGQPYVGIDIVQTNQKFATGFGKKLFYMNPKNYGVMAGMKVNELFGFELGYEFQQKAVQQIHFASGRRTTRWD